LSQRYDTILIGNFFAYPEFAKKFGDYYEDIDEWQVSAAWQTGLNMASTVGGIFGTWAFPDASVTSRRVNIKLLKAVS
jgi:SP family general alpha glucoside:H+ symporter-like MFS transporter